MEYAPFVEVGPDGLPWISKSLLMAHSGWDEASKHHHSSPAHFAQRERERARLGPKSLKAVPVDAFSWALGPSPGRGGTQVGGTPYWPADKAWPEINGKLATFLAQLNFHGSKDLLPDLPGAVLSIFVRDEDFYGDELFQVFWMPAGLEDLLPLGSHPDPAFEFIHAHGVRFRTVDDPRIKERVECADKDEDEEAYELAVDVAVTAATKVGGCAWDPQGEGEFMDPGDRYLGALCSIQGQPDFAWPWANQPEPLGRGFDSGGMHHPTQNLMLGDMGNLNFFLHASGELRMGGSCF